MSDGYRRVIRALRLQREESMKQAESSMIGRRYWVYQDGERLDGEIIGRRGFRWVVRWSNGEETEEARIDPAGDCPARAWAEES